jgi:hypothetical protein
MTFLCLKHYNNFIQSFLLCFIWFMTMHWWFITRNKTNKCIYRYVNVLYCKHVWGLAIYNTVNSHIFICTYWSYFSSSVFLCVVCIFYLFEHITCLKEFFPTYHTTNAVELVSYPLSTVEVKLLLHLSKFFYFLQFCSVEVTCGST